LETGTLYSASEDCTVKIWTRHENFFGELGTALEQAEAQSRGAAASVKPVELYSCTATLTGHTNLVRYVLKHRNILYSSSNDATIRAWDLDNDGKCIKVFKGGHADLINSLVLVDGSRLISCSHDNLIVQWDTSAIDAPLVHLQCRYGIIGSVAAQKLSGVRDDIGTTSLMAAAAGGHLDNALLVLKHQSKLKLEDRNKFGQSALLLALRGRRWDFLKHFALGPEDSDDGQDAVGGLTLPQKDASIRELVLRRAARGDTEFFLQLRGAGVLLGAKLESAVIIEALEHGAHDLVMSVWGDTRTELRDKVCTFLTSPPPPSFSFPLSSQVSHGADTSFVKASSSPSLLFGATSPRSTPGSVAQNFSQRTQRPGPVPARFVLF
jgi:WD domain, G-beta repeat